LCAGGGLALSLTAGSIVDIVAEANREEAVACGQAIEDAGLTRSTVDTANVPQVVIEQCRLKPDSSVLLNHSWTFGYGGVIITQTRSTVTFPSGAAIDETMQMSPNDGDGGGLWIPSSLGLLGGIAIGGLVTDFGNEENTNKKNVKAKKPE